MADNMKVNKEVEQEVQQNNAPASPDYSGDEKKTFMGVLNQSAAERLDDEMFMDGPGWYQPR